MPDGKVGAGAEAGINSDVTDWRDRDDYKKMSQKYLRPYHKELLELFKRIG